MAEMFCWFVVLTLERKICSWFVECIQELVFKKPKHLYRFQIHRSFSQTLGFCYTYIHGYFFFNLYNFLCNLFLWWQLMTLAEEHTFIIMHYIFYQDIQQYFTFNSIKCCFPAMLQFISDDFLCNKMLFPQSKVPYILLWI